jgi:hypothetical protein
MKTEYHNTKSGIVSVTYVDKAYEPAMEKAHAGIGQVVARPNGWQTDCGLQTLHRYRRILPNGTHAGSQSKAKNARS